MKTLKKPATYKIHPDVLAMLKREADKQGRSMAYVVEAAITGYVVNKESRV